VRPRLQSGASVRPLNFTVRRRENTLMGASSSALPTVHCKTHGTRSTATVCAHMIGTVGPLGFVENSSDPEDLQAWCYDCERLFEKEQGLTEAFRRFNDFAVVCDRCYVELKIRHSRLD
jgi:hypothetical protein